MNPASKLQITTSAGGSDGYLKIKDETHGGDVRFGIEGGVNNDALLGKFTANGVGIYTDSAKRFSLSEVGFSSFTPSTSSDDYGLSIVKATPLTPALFLDAVERAIAKWG